MSPPVAQVEGPWRFASTLSWVVFGVSVVVMGFQLATRDDVVHIALTDETAPEFMAADSRPLGTYTFETGRLIRPVVCLPFSGSRADYEDATSDLTLVWVDGYGEPTVELPFDEAVRTPRYTDERRCTEFDGSLIVAGDYTLELSGEAGGLDEGPVGTLVVEATPTHVLERIAIGGMLFAMFLKMLSWFQRSPASMDKKTRNTASKWAPFDPILGVLAVIIGGLVIGIFTGTTRVVALTTFIDSGGGAPEVIGTTAISWSSSRSFLVMVTNALLYVGVAWGMARMHNTRPSEALRVTRTTPGAVVGALFGGGLLAIGATILLVTFSPEESSPMQWTTLIPGSMLATAAVASLSPWYEELFFRGFLFSSIEKLTHGLVALFATAALFTLAHVPQHIGFFVPLIPILAVALSTSTLRYVTGTTTASFALHLGYNAILVTPVLFTP